MDVNQFLFLSLSFVIYLYGVSGFRSPKGLNAVLTPDGQLNVTWQQHKKWYNGSDSFYLLSIRPSSDPDGSSIVRVWNNSYVTPAQGHTEYTVMVRYQKGKRKTPWSSPVLSNMAVPSSGTSTKNLNHKVPRPRSLRIKSITTSTAKLKWKHPRKIPIDRIDMYRVLWRIKARKTEMAKLPDPSDQDNDDVDENLEHYTNWQELNTTKQSIRLTGLQPNTVYTTKVQLITKDGKESRFLKNKFRTENFPRKILPLNFTAQQVGPKKVRVEWHYQPADNQWIKGYKLQYRRVSEVENDVCSVVLDKGVTWYNVTDLVPNETYQIRLATRTIKKRHKAMTPWMQFQLNNDHNSTQMTDSSMFGNDDVGEKHPCAHAQLSVYSYSVEILFSKLSTDDCTVHISLVNEENRDPVWESRLVVSSRGGSAVIPEVMASAWYTMNITMSKQGNPKLVQLQTRFQTQEPIEKVYAIHTQVHSPFLMVVQVQFENSTIVDNEQYILQWHSDSFTNFSTIVGASSPASMPNLTPSTTYHIELFSVSNTEKTLIKAWTAQTPKLTNLAEESVAVEPVNDSCLLVLWKYPAEGYHDNVNMHIAYFLTVSTRDRSKHVLVPGTEDTHAICRLLPGQSYTLHLRMEAAVGRAVSNTIVITGTTFAAYQQAETTVPDPPSDVFLYLINTHLNVSWLPPPAEFFGLVRWYQIEVYRNTLPWKSYRVRKDIYSLKVQPVDVDTDYIVDVSAANSMGASAPVRRILLAQQVNTSVLWYSVRSLTGTPIGSSRIEVQWLAPASGNLTRYLIRYRPNIRVGLNSSHIIDQWVEPSFSSYVIVGLEENEEYAISVTPYFNDVNGNSSTVYIITQSDLPDAPPSNVTVIVTDFNNIDVTWSPPPFASWNGNLTGYRLSLRPQNQSMQARQDEVSPSTHTLKWTGLSYDKQYYVRVAAVNVIGSGPWSIEKSVRTLPNPVFTRPPGPPESVTLSPHEFGIHLSWEPPHSATPVTGYIVGHGRFLPDVYRHTMDGGQTEFTITGLRSRTSYLISVRAFNQYGESSAVTHLGISGLSANRNNPNASNNEHYEDEEPGGDAPPRLTVTETNDEVVTLIVKWEPPATLYGIMEGYLLYYTKDSTFSPETTDVVFSRSEEVTLKNMDFDTIYYFRVKVQYKQSFGTVSNIVPFETKAPDNSVPLMPKPTITSVLSGPDYLEVTWLPPAANAHVVYGYILGFGLHEANEAQELLPARITNHQFNNLARNTTYYISLRVFNKHGQSEQTFVNATTS